MLISCATTKRSRLPKNTPDLSLARWKSKHFYLNTKNGEAIAGILSFVVLYFFFSKGCWTADDLHAVSGRLHQSAVWQSIRGGCTEINVLPGVSDVSVALLAADWSQTSLHPQPAVLPGSHTDQVIRWKLFWQNFDRQPWLGRVSWQICQLFWY